MLKLQTEPRYDTLRPKLEYVLSLFNRWYRLPRRELTVSYGGTADAEIQISPGDWTEFYGDTHPVPEEVTWIEWEGKRLPLLCQQSPSGEIVQTDDEDDTVVVTADILGTAFYFLSCWQEWMSENRDQYGRFPASESLLYRWGLLDTPVVNYYYDILAAAVGRVTGRKPKPEPPGEAPFYVALTHDIDQCMTGWMEDSFRALMGGHPLTAVKTVWQRLADRDVWFNFDEMMALEESLSVKAAYYFLPEQQRSGNRSNADYRMDFKELRTALKDLQAAGHEIGIHGSLGSGKNSDQLREEISRIPVPVTGGRFHFLAMAVPESFDILERSGLRYDMTLGFAEHPGFRNGVCYPFTPYDIRRDRAYSFIEIPLMVMDRTFTNYLRVEPEATGDYIGPLLTAVRKFGGVLTLLWHNKSFSGYKYRGWEQPFLETVKSAGTDQGAILLPQDIADLYNRSE